MFYVKLFSQKKLPITLIFLVFLMLNGCFHPCFFSIRGDGNIIEEYRAVGPFTSVISRGAFDVIITKGHSGQIQLVGDKNLLNHISTYVTADQTLIIESRRTLNPSRDIKIFVQMEIIEKLTIEGSGEMRCKDRFEGHSLGLWILGSGSINFNYIKADEVKNKIAGSGDIILNADCSRIVNNIICSGDITLVGNSDTLVLDICASGNLKAFDFISKECEINILGSGDARVYITDLLNVNIAGSGNVYYKGNPLRINSNITGSGKLIQVD